MPVRLEIANPRQLLKPAMFAEVELPVGGKGKVLTVPISAVIDSGTRRIVLVQLAEGRFEPREVKLGARSDNYVEVMDGVKEGEQVVVAANFLIDAESNLKAAIGRLRHPAAGSAPPAHAGTAAGRRRASSATRQRSRPSTRNPERCPIAHGPVATLKWPAMTMDFKAANSALLADLKPGAAIDFEFVERSPANG